MSIIAWCRVEFFEIYQLSHHWGLLDEVQISVYNFVGMWENQDKWCVYLSYALKVVRTVSNILFHFLLNYGYLGYQTSDAFFWDILWSVNSWTIQDQSDGFTYKFTVIGISFQGYTRAEAKADIKFSFYGFIIFF